MTDDRDDEQADSARAESATDNGSGNDAAPADAPVPFIAARRMPEGERRGAERRGNVYLLPGATTPPDVAAPEHADAGTAAEHADPGAGTAAEHAGAAGPESSTYGDGAEREDWAWVREWRDGGEPTPWSTGVVLAVFAALLTGVAVWVLSAGLSDRPIVAVLVNLLVAAGLAPAIWLSRGLPVLRWIAAGAAVGIVVGWTSAVLMLPLPAP